MLYFMLAVGYTAVWYVVGLVFRVDEPVEFAVKALGFTFLFVCACLFLAMIWVVLFG